MTEPLGKTAQCFVPLVDSFEAAMEQKKREQGMTYDEKRELFEKWIISRGCSAMKRDGGYVDSMSRLWWECWQAALSAPQAQAAEEGVQVNDEEPLSLMETCKFLELSNVELSKEVQRLKHELKAALACIPLLRQLNAQAQAVKVPDALSGRAYTISEYQKGYADGWNRCRAEVIRLNAAPTNEGDGK